MKSQIDPPFFFQKISSYLISSASKRQAGDTHQEVLEMFHDTELFGALGEDGEAGGDPGLEKKYQQVHWEKLETYIIIFSYIPDDCFQILNIYLTTYMLI